MEIKDLVFALVYGAAIIGLYWAIKTSPRSGQEIVQESCKIETKIEVTCSTRSE